VADAPGAAALPRALVELARRLDGGDPLRDEPATIFRPLDPEPPAPPAPETPSDLE